MAKFLVVVDVKIKRVARDLGVFWRLGVAGGVKNLKRI
jgi:hypothetical protein